MKPFCCLPARRSSVLLSLAVAAAGLSPAVHADALGDAIAGGKMNLELRYRFENVDQDAFASGKKANASTLRTRLRYSTAEWESMTAMVELDHVSLLGDERFNDTRNGETTFPLVTDPHGGDLNQALIKYVGISNTVLTVGRQRLNLDNQRFIGSVGWRQNEQTLDGALVEFKGIDRLTASYAFVTRVNRIFGPEGTPVPFDAKYLSEYDGETHLVNLKYVLNDKFTGVLYDYMLDFDNAAPTMSTQTIGFRATGKIPVSDFKLGYSAEYAEQSDYKDNPTSFNAPYELAELTFGKAGEKLTWEAMAGYEVLGEDNLQVVQTPLATLHKFQGWADKFLATPNAASGRGLVDTYVGGTVTVAGYGFTLVGHTYEADDTGLDFGDELNFQVAKTFAKRYTLTAKYADYSQGDAATGATKTDTTKAWLMAEAKF